MSDQSAVSEWVDKRFGLIETLLWTREEGYALLDEHLARLAASSASLGFAFNAEAVAMALENVVANASHGRLRVRLVLSRGGELETSMTPIEAIPSTTIWRVALAQSRFRASEPMLRHKTTRRALYEDELEQAIKSYGADEVLFLNERDEICEGARVNVFIPHGNVLLTPPLASGLLPGTLRARLISEGRASEAVLGLNDLPAQFYVGNSVRGLVRARRII
jgi:branched-subunit amino acid aminotransferase/4-amino-4-deoxychorismate lyase